MSDLITDAMVETAARAAYNSGSGGYNLWAHATICEEEMYLEDARAALEAAAPLIAATARAETTTEATERIARQIAATSAMTGRDALELVEAVQALQNAETTTDLQLLAEGWDKCVKSLRYEDGSPVEIVGSTNPYRKMLEGLDAKEAEQ